MAVSAHVTRDVEPAAVADLCDAAPRATVAFIAAGGIELLPARACGAGEGTRFAIRTDGAPDLDGREVVLVRDDGGYFFELRGLSVRGKARRAAGESPPEGAELAWYTIEAKRILAWDYATMREE